jgi:hypothetical protein
VHDAVAKSQQYDAVHSQYLVPDEFPARRNGKVDKWELFAGTKRGCRCGTARGV